MATDSTATNLRFFGKIFGTERDYYIAEGVFDGGQEELADGEERPANFEARGSGVNLYAYWVTDNVLNNWILLPDLQPNDVVASR